MPGKRKPARWSDRERGFMFWAHPDTARKHYAEIKRELLAQVRKKRKRKKRGRK
jgi:hypothetical protein